MPRSQCAFETVFKDQDFEIRDYHAAIAVDVTLVGGRDQTARLALRLLKHYLAGANDVRQRLTIIPPILQVRSQGRTNGAIAPVVQSDDFGLWTLRLFLDHPGRLASLPFPDDRRVCLNSFPPSRYAALSFTGLARIADIKAKTGVVSWMALKCQELATGPAWVAGYSSSWMPWFLRHNEVLLPLRSRTSQQAAAMFTASPTADWILVPSFSGWSTHQERPSS